jgi:lipoate-protein ligase A
MAVIPSEVEESLNPCETARDVSTALDMTTRVFAALHVYHDDAAQSAALNMAIDEALLDYATAPSVRFYRWHSPALSFGYFGKFTDAADYASGRELIRRWTGGGIVLHGEDLTYALVIPAGHLAFDESSALIYERVHHALSEALNATGERAALCERRSQVDSAVTDRRYSCFANPVRADVMIRGRKVAGAAQRRTRRGLLQQGSIQGVNIDDGLAKRFAEALSPNRTECKTGEQILVRAQELAQEKYGTDSWLRKR